MTLNHHKIMYLHYEIHIHFKDLPESCVASGWTYRDRPRVSWVEWVPGMSSLNNHSVYETQINVGVPHASFLWTAKATHLNINILNKYSRLRLFIFTISLMMFARVSIVVVALHPRILQWGKSATKFVKKHSKLFTSRVIQNSHSTHCVFVQRRVQLN